MPMSFNRNEIKCSLIFSTIIATCFTVGKAMYDSNKVESVLTPKSIIYFILSLAVSFVIFCLMKKLVEFLRQKTSKKWKIFSNNKLVIYWIIIFACYIPSFLAYYPGVYSYDVQMETPVALGLWEMNSGNPPLHIWIWKAFLLFEEKTGIMAVTSYGIFSMLVVSFSLAYAEKYICQKSSNNIIPTLSLIFFALNPVFAIMSIVITKDVLFGAVLVLYMVQLSKLVLDTKDFFTNRKNTILAVVNKNWTRFSK